MLAELALNITEWVQRANQYRVSLIRGRIDLEVS